ncbi:MAG: aminomethyl-transferring glycine dehydrogenase subunit GcvPB [Nitrospirae bacterium]|nr:aminomethyl-transferring glycine dehydrogenase subunit GcvPB [Nitrospirota bacterium]
MAEAKRDKLIFEKSVSGRKAYALPPLDVPESSLESLFPSKFLRKEPPGLPEVSELDLVRHYVKLSQKNFSIDSGFYPLGSCTMKYNPKINDEIARLPGLAALHPLQPEETLQGALGLLYALEELLKEILGFDRISFQPVAGAQGEMVGLMMIRAYLQSKGENRHKVLIPDSAHGTNPASAMLAGFEVEEIRSNSQGLIDLDDLKKHMDRDCAALMLTNPNTLGLFEKDIIDISKVVHEAGGLMYMDGANLNALLGLVRPGDMGFDVVHSNLHKTFSTPHGGGGPGAGAVAVKAFLAPFLPKPTIEKKGERYVLDDNRPDSIGKVSTFYGNFGNLVRAYVYIRSNGAEGLARISQMAILNANYVRSKLEKVLKVAQDRICMHEVVFSAKKFKSREIHARDICKRLMDYGFHPPTVYFPLIVEEALMIEPTETESKETLDSFCDALISISKEIELNPELLLNAPFTTPVGRLDETEAVKKLNVRWKKG